ncbi:TetR-like C-terminal domain-containing protein, partial [Nocardia wallacei]|uniref:TetR-like C-terminal domain-containing protein n=1 Tax=Nocardia wallacei TaxID=480035 RepID=UPI0024549E1E
PPTPRGGASPPPPPPRGPLKKPLAAPPPPPAAPAAALHRFYDTRLTEWSPCIHAAIERGELPAGTDSRTVLSAVSAPLYYRLLASGDPIDDGAATAAADAAVLAARAGLFAPETAGP